MFLLRPKSGLRIMCEIKVIVTLSLVKLELNDCIINIKSNILAITLAKFHIISSLTHDIMYCFMVFCEVTATAYYVTCIMATAFSSIHSYSQ